MTYVKHPTLPSVTAILASCGLAGDYANIPEAVLEVARERGSAVHEAIEMHHYDCLDMAEVPEACHGYLKGYLRFMEETKHEPIVSELEVISGLWRFVGHVDRVAWFNGKRTIWDWKTTSSLDVAEVSYQLAGYRIAYNEEHPKEPAAECYALHLKPNSTYRVHCVPDITAAESVFKAATVVYHAKANGNAKH